MSTNSDVDLWSVRDFAILNESASAPTEENSDVVKDAFYAKLEDVYDKTAEGGPNYRTVQPPNELYLQ